MKLVEILTRDWDQWCGYESVFQSSGGDLFGRSGLKAQLIGRYAVATDHATAIVTREMWEAERLSLEDEQDAATVRERQGQPTVPVSLEPDWSKAPEWADRHGFIGRGEYPVWFNQNQYQYCDSDRVFDFESGDSFDRNQITSATKRPTTPQWSGPEDGLPPVGTVCEYQRSASRGIWKEVEVFAVKPNHNGSSSALFQYTESPREWAASAYHGDFRPIDQRTPREKWIEAALALDCDPCEGMLSRKDFCGKVYDAMIAKLPEDGE